MDQQRERRERLLQVLRKASQQSARSDAMLAIELERARLVVAMLMHVCRIDAYSMLVEYLRREYEATDPRELSDRELERVHRAVLQWTSPIG